MKKWLRKKLGIDELESEVERLYHVLEEKDYAIVNFGDRTVVENTEIIIPRNKDGIAFLGSQFIIRGCTIRGARNKVAVGVAANHGVVMDTHIDMTAPSQESGKDA